MGVNGGCSLERLFGFTGEGDGLRQPYESYVVVVGGAVVVFVGVV